MASTPQLQEQIILSFSCKDLPSLDTLSKSDPFIILYSLDHDGRQLVKHRVHRTEYILNNEDPVFSKRFQTSYFFEREQRFLMEVYDVDGTDSGDLNVNVSGFDFMGECEFTLAQVMSAYNTTFSVQLKDKSGRPVVKASAFSSNPPKSLCIIRGDQLQTSSYKLFLQASGVNLPKTFFSKPDTQLEIIKKRPDGSELAVYQSAIITETCSPHYPLAKIDMSQIVDGQEMFDKPFTIRISKVKSGGKREVLGEVVKSIRQISPPKDITQPGEPLIFGQNITVPLMEGNKQRGDLHLKLIKVVQEYTFLDYITSGLQLCFTVGIDFTGSNGQPGDLTSLHYQGPNNQYVHCIRSIGQIIAAYAQQQFFPTYGFGGHVSIDNGPVHTSHCFPLSLTSSIPCANGVEDIVNQYAHTINRLQLSGPTFFEPIITATHNNSLRPFTADNQYFNILLLLTDGICNDINNAVDAIVKASATPMCIIIVGVGSADFSSMEFLDSDDSILTSKTLGPAKHDIVQFVPYNQYAGRPQALASAVLAEIPQQVQEWFNMNAIRPLDRNRPPPAQQYIPPQ